jgi:hypothetical protein
MLNQFLTLLNMDFNENGIFNLDEYKNRNKREISLFFYEKSREIL